MNADERESAKSAVYDIRGARRRKNKHPAITSPSSTAEVRSRGDGASAITR
jgi:hypothetical protein